MLGWLPNLRRWLRKPPSAPAAPQESSGAGPAPLGSVPAPLSARDVFEEDILQTLTQTEPVAFAGFSDDVLLAYQTMTLHICFPVDVGIEEPNPAP